MHKKLRDLPSTLEPLLVENGKECSSSGLGFIFNPDAENKIFDLGLALADEPVTTLRNFGMRMPDIHPRQAQLDCIECRTYDVECLESSNANSMFAFIVRLRKKFSAFELHLSILANGKYSIAKKYWGSHAGKCSCCT